ncbi:Hypothetical predicted protein [Olea europaea subsp. europaea]|uniref:Uncharacterized protein n=1 Tax=Olea europaea subsp. europaea TaxID=158383 RepID=A0A8S0Q5U9_OLEEU|nr:Hypothetical predicted protein [Olea europaea subsp. europaea]
MEEPERLPQMLSPCSSGRRLSSDSNSPEFEFWMIRNPSFPQPNLHSADELFSDGVLLPLQVLQTQFSEEQSEPQRPPPQEVEPSGLDQVQERTAELADLSSTTAFTSSKRWKDIFKKSDKKNTVTVSNGNSDCSGKEKGSSKEKKREKKCVGVGGSNGVSAAELNINIWPFLRSRSAGNGGSRPRTGSGSTAATRKVSSAPCSRSNSAGESKSRKWPSSPSRGGVHLGRSSPVWQVRRCGGGASVGRNSEAAVKSFAEKGVKKDGNETHRKISTASDVGKAKGRALNLNVPMCIGYGHNLGCRSDENSPIGGTVAAAAAAVSGGGESSGSGSGEGVRGSNLFNIRSFFTKKVY